MTKVGSMVIPSQYPTPPTNNPLNIICGKKIPTKAHMMSEDKREWDLIWRWGITPHNHFIGYNQLHMIFGPENGRWEALKNMASLIGDHDDSDCLPPTFNSWRRWSRLSTLALHIRMFSYLESMFEHTIACNYVSLCIYPYLSFLCHLMLGFLWTHPELNDTGGQPFFPHCLH